MSYGSIDGGSFGSRNPFGGPMRQGYQPVGKNKFTDFIVVTLEKNLQSLGTSRDTAELRQSLHSTQQQTNKVITSTSQLIKQLSDIISGSSRQDRLRLTRLKTELSESVQRYGDLQKVSAYVIYSSNTMYSPLDMLDVSQIMRDLASMVHEQGDAIDSIEDYIQTASSNVESANQELAKANQYQVTSASPVLHCCLTGSQLTYLL
uniref:t-SNARE Domain Containing 1 n=1 Tax=Acanthochromis polyacanthus TaxID=80966 RepID=A0A3Q1ECJ0_9TELE